MTDKKPTLEYGKSDESARGCADYLLILALYVGLIAAVVVGAVLLYRRG